jgi:hypothetical protein
LTPTAIPGENNGMEEFRTATDGQRERRFIAGGLAVLSFLGFVGFPILSRDSWSWFPYWMLWSAWLIGLPAWTIGRFLGSNISPLERTGYGSTLALVGLAVAQLIAMELGNRWLVMGYPILTMATLILRRSTVEPTATSPPFSRVALGGGVVALGLALGLMSILPSFFLAKAPVLAGDGKERWVKLITDVVLHLQAQEEMSHTWPAQFSPAAGTPLRYHLAADALTLALTPPGIPRLTANCRYMTSLWHVIVMVNSLLLGRRFLGNTWFVGLFPLLVVFGEDGGWIVTPLKLPMNPCFPNFPSFFWYNPNLPGLAVMLGGLGALGLALQTKNARSQIAAGVLLGGAALFKVFIGVQAGFALVFALLLVGWDAKKILLLVALVLGIFAGLVAFLYRYTFDAPNQHILYEPLPEMLTYAWFIPIVLGLRMLGAWELFRIPLFERSSPLKVVIVGLVLTGLVGFFIRISAMVLPGLLGYNNGVWFAVVAKVPCWLLVLGAIQRARLGNTGRAILASTVTAVAVFGSYPFIRFQLDVQYVATPANRFRPDDLDLIPWLEKNTNPGEVVICDSDFPMGITALLPLRTPCPQGHEIGYAISFMTYQEFALRLDELCHFWNSWFQGTLRSDYVAKHNVRWVISPADVELPVEARLAYSNATWAIYEMPRPATSLAGKK